MRKRLEKEGGAALILITASLLVLMGITAVVVDGGMGFSERRQAQSGVDFASLAALQEAVSCPSPCTAQAAANNGATEAMARVAGNLPGRTLDWAACTDPNRPAKFVNVASTTPCVSFTYNFDESRVVLPLDAVDTSFGKVIGFASIDVSAFAEAGEDSTIIAKVIPHTPNGTAGAEACLMSNQAPQTVEPCSGAASGFYGYLDVALYGDNAPGDTPPGVGNPSTCTQGDTNTRIAINLAKGSDHNMVKYEFVPSPDPVVNDHAACPNKNEEVNELRVETGSPTGALEDGLFDGVSGSINGEPLTSWPGRLVCDTSTYSTMCADVRGQAIDHTGLWEFLISGCGSTPTNHDEMKACLDGPGTDPSFSIDILQHPRFAAIPIFWNTPTGPGNYKIKEFIPVWLEKTYYSCNANKCDAVHSPGATFGTPAPGTPAACPASLTSDVDNCGWDSNGALKLEGLTALMLDVDMLPEEVREDFPGKRGSREYFLTE